jgi:hypothetical protein
MNRIKITRLTTGKGLVSAHIKRTTAALVAKVIPAIKHILKGKLFISFTAPQVVYSPLDGILALKLKFIVRQ